MLNFEFKYNLNCKSSPRPRSTGRDFESNYYLIVLYRCSRNVISQTKVYFDMLCLSFSLSKFLIFYEKEKTCSDLINPDFIQKF